MDWDALGDIAVGRAAGKLALGACLAILGGEVRSPSGVIIAKFLF